VVYWWGCVSASPEAAAYFGMSYPWRKEQSVSVKIRLRRQGARKQPTYRIVVADSRAPRDGRFIEVIGHYNPRREPAELVINHDKAQEWLQKGATTTETVNTLFRREGLPARPSRRTVALGRRKAEAEAAVRKEQRIAARQAGRPAKPVVTAPAEATDELSEETTTSTADEGGAE